MIVLEVFYGRIKPSYSVSDFLAMPEDMIGDSSVSIVHKAIPHLF